MSQRLREARTRNENYWAGGGDIIPEECAEILEGN